MTDVAYLSAGELAAQIRARRLSPVELMQSVTDRIAARNPSLNALVYEAFDEAHAAAREAERSAARGGELSPLHGVPTAVKDLYDAKPGWPTTFGGLPALRDNVARKATSWAELTERAGAIVVGKTNSCALGFRGTCDNELFGPTQNPFAAGLNSGGSSGGAAAAVADGLLPLAEGTDAGGSIRVPAAWCGVYGFKQSFGTVPRFPRPNAFASSPFVFEGVLTRSVADAALWLAAVAGHDSRDPFSVPAAGDFVAATERSAAGLRIAWMPEFGGVPVQAGITSVLADAVRVFEELGGHVEEVDCPPPRDQRELSDLWCRLVVGSGIATLEAAADSTGVNMLAEHSDELPPPFRSWVQVCRRQTDRDRAHDQALRTEVYDWLTGLLETYDLIATPTVGCLPVPNASRRGDTVGPAAINGTDVDELIGWCLTYLINFTGHPAASVPAGTLDGLPVGMQLVGRRWGDDTVLAASAAFERRRPWMQLYQQCRNRTLR